MDKLSVETKDIKYLKIDEIIRSPSRSPSKYRDIQTISTGVSQLKIENKTKKNHVKINQYFGCPDNEVFCIKIDEDDNFLAAGTSEGVIRIYSISNGNLVVNLEASDIYTPTTCLRWKPMNKEGILVSGNADGNVSLWKTGSGKRVYQISEKNNQILCLDYNCLGSHFATAGTDFQIRIYDEGAKSLSHTFTEGSFRNPGHTNRIFALKFLNDNPNLLLSGGWDSNVYLWDLRNHKSVGSFFGANISGDALDYKDGIVLTGSHRNKDNLQIWDLKKFELLKNIEWDKLKKVDDAYIYAAQFSKNDKRNGYEGILAGCSGENEVRLFDRQNLDNCLSVININKGCYTVDFANIENKFAFSGPDGIIYVCKINA